MAGPKLGDLRKAIASTLTEVKAYDLPTVCARVGLDEGSSEEAFSSKFTYVHTRLLRLERDALLAVAERVLNEFQSPGLEECAAAIDEEVGRPLTQIIRRRLIDYLQTIDLAGQLRDDLELLEPIFPLEDMPTIYPELRRSQKTLRADIERHRVEHDDWTNAELLTHLGVTTCSRRRVFALLERIVDPMVRADEAQAEIVERLNEFLQRDGYELAQTRKVSGYAVYAVRLCSATGESPADRELTAQFQKLDNAGVDRLWAKALERRTSDPEGAITIARTLLERSCKHILDEARLDYTDKDDLPRLWALAAEHLNLAPSQHTEVAFKTILGSCQNVVNTIGTLRNRLGDSHAQKGRPVRPQPRHAELVVNLAGSMAKFLMATWLDQARATRSTAPDAAAEDNADSSAG